MIELWWRLPPGIIPANRVAEEFSGSGTIGFVVLAIIVGPVIMLTLAAILGSPRNFRVPGLFLGSVVLLIGSLIGFFVVAGTLLGFVVPR
ncbi:MAG: hypothetical protein HY663_06605 [Chloroflexi bacterium]|nr:hypothetical protein [Chloroflexota bacterium]